MAMHTPFDYGVVSFGPLSAFVKQKTIKTLCARRVVMLHVTLDSRQVDCIDCAFVEAWGLDNTYHLAHGAAGLTQEWRDRFGKHCPCRRHSTPHSTSSATPPAVDAGTDAGTGNGNDTGNK